ncbi:glomulin-like [Cololabis saira]|uniref:glomulin-like n=1 Tax=Cololabis saira TaxID=129043 RepID=UPI002AD4DFC5|nr:glomulin-like [Cololabis saira]
MLTMKEDELNDIIQRWRGIEEQDLTCEDQQQLKNLAAACLSLGDGEQLLRITQDHKNQGIVKSMGWVLLAPLLKEVVKDGASRDHCRAAVTHLTKTCSPNKLLHSLLDIIEDIDPGTISETILILLPHLQLVLLRLGHRRAASVGLALSALQKQLCRLPVPYTEEQEEADEHGLGRCCSALAGFTKPFVEEMRKNSDNTLTSAEDDEMRTELLKFCMKSLREPLLEAELNQDRKSALWLFAAEIMVILPAIKESLSGLLFFNTLRKSAMPDGDLSKEARACLAYLLFVQLITMDSFPAVFSPVFTLQCNMEHINQLLSSKKESHLLKGLELFVKSLNKVEDNSLPVGLLDLKSFYSVPQNLRLVLIDCPMQHLRESGLQVFQLFIDKLDAEAKYKFFMCMLKTSNHAGVEGYIVKNIRNQIDVSIKTNGSRWFVGKELLSLLGLVLSLPQGAETDLLARMDMIMESLNLLRYVVIRDEELSSHADEWKELRTIQAQYLKTLRACISLSRAYYSSELKTLKEDQKLKAKEARDAARATRLVKSMTVKHENMSMSPQEQHQVLQSALVTFDLMESLINRVEEVAEDKKARSS